MFTATLTTASLLALVAGCLLLALSQHRPVKRHRAFRGQPALLRKTQLVLRVTGGLALTLSLWSAAQDAHLGYALTRWFGLFTVSSLAVALVLAIHAYRQSRPS